MQRKVEEVCLGFFLLRAKAADVSEEILQKPKSDSSDIIRSHTYDIAAITSGVQSI